MAPFVQQPQQLASAVSPSSWGDRTTARLSPPAQHFLSHLIQMNLLLPEVVHTFLQQRADRLLDYPGEVEIGRALVEADLLTSFQLERILSGGTHGLLLGNYRILDQIGSGGMGLVYVGEHRLMKRRVAIKVLPVDECGDNSLRQRFYAEMRVLAELNHPNIVQAFDAGDVPPPGPNMPALTYLVMELVPGGDLEHYVERFGPLSVSQACDWIRQASQGLQVAHDLHVVHRDIKPSNLLLDAPRPRTPGPEAGGEGGLWGHVKLVDFGLVRQFCSQLTDPRALLGSVEFMAPEQSFDPSGVGPEADIYGLGATLFFLLTGEAPHPFTRNIGGALRALQRDNPRRLRDLRPDVPPKLDELVAAMLSRDPSARPGPPLAISTALATLTVAPTRTTVPTPGEANRLAPGELAELESSRRRALIVDDEAPVRLMIRQVLQSMGCVCTEAADGRTALNEAGTGTFDLVILDLSLPDMNGKEICRTLRDRPRQPYLKILVVSGIADSSALASTLPNGADDYLAKPFEANQFRARAEQALRVKEIQDRMLVTTEQYRRANRQLEVSLEASKADLRQAHDALLFAMARMAESRDGETPGHFRRLQRYVQVLTERAAQQPAWGGYLDRRFSSQLQRCVCLHDIGKIGLPDDVLLKTTPLTAAERLLVEQHPIIGDRILESLGREHGEALDFLPMARAIVRHHHERYDGYGYPDRLVGEAIPVSARLVAIADVYDALRRERAHKPAMTHAGTARLILKGSPGQFDPMLLQAFEQCHEEFDRIYREIGE